MHRFSRYIITAANISLMLFTELAYPLVFKSSDGNLFMPFLPMLIVSVTCAFENIVALFVVLKLLFSVTNPSKGAVAEYSFDNEKKRK